MKIRMLVSIAGNADARYGLGDFSFAAGQVVDVDKVLAAAWIAAGNAEKPKAEKPEPAQDAKADDSATVQEGA